MAKCCFNSFPFIEWSLRERGFDCSVVGCSMCGSSGILPDSWRIVKVECRTLVGGKYYCFRSWGADADIRVADILKQVQRMVDNPLSLMTEYEAAKIRDKLGIPKPPP